MKMMKKAIALALSMMMVLALTACGSSEEKSESNESGDSAMRAALILDGPIDDGGWNADCYNGLVRLGEELGYETAYSENVDQADYVSAIREYAAEGYDLIILSGNQFLDATKEVYEDFPETHFAGINFGYTDTNVSSMKFNDIQSGFLAGAFAGLMTETNAVGYIGGTEISSITDALEGFEKGAKYVNPDCEVVSSMTGSWSDVAKGKELALSQISTSNVDVIFGFASACNTGMIEACKEQGKMYIAEPLDIMSTEPDVIIGSLLEKNSELIVSIGEMVQDGITEGQSITGDVANNVLAFGEFSESVPQEVQDQLKEIIDGIIDGSVTIE